MKLLMALFILITTIANAASLQVSPVYVESSNGIDKITLTNSGDKPIFAQVRVFDWAVKQDADLLTPTQSVLASPPIIKIAPQGKQVVRIMRVGKAPLMAEETYRLLVDELSDDPVIISGVSVKLRYSIPVFITPASAAAADVHTKARIEGDQLVLDLDNSGGRYARIGRVLLRSPDGQTQAVSAGLLGYVMAKSGRRWFCPIPALASKQPFSQVQLDVNGQAVVVDF